MAKCGGMLVRRARGPRRLVLETRPCRDGGPGRIMLKEYARKIEGVYRIADTRLSLDSVVYLFREGVSAEGIAESYPALTLDQVHGALAFYLGNQTEIDTYLAEGHRIANAQQEQSRRTNAELIANCNARAMRIKYQADADFDG